MKSSIIKFEEEWIFFRHSEILLGRPTILFIHGLGESSLSFLEAFDSSFLREFNLIAPDLVGYGCSSKAINADYSFKSQAIRFFSFIERINVSEIYLVGHSMGADLSTCIISNNSDEKIRGFVNIEGDLTPFDIFISNQALLAESQGKFSYWFRNEYMNETVLNKWGQQWESCRRYYASLWLCSEEAFLQTAREICLYNKVRINKQLTEIGELFQQITIPKVYCWGQYSLAEETKNFISENDIPNKEFTQAFHWLMIDKDNEFYPFLATFCSEI